MSAFDDDCAIAEAVFAELFGDEYTIYRDSEPLTITMQTLGRESVIDESTGVMFEIEQWRFLAAADDYVFSGARTAPARGDVIEDGAGRRYEVLPDGAAPAASPADPAGAFIVIRAKRIETW